MECIKTRIISVRAVQESMTLPHVLDRGNYVKKPQLNFVCRMIESLQVLALFPPKGFNNN